MGNPEGGHPERKDEAHFLKEVDKLYEEAASNGQREIAIVLGVLKAAILKDGAEELSELCMAMAKQISKEAKQKNSKPLN